MVQAKNSKLQGRLRWGKRAEDRFLRSIAEDGNVARAAKLARFSSTTCYNKRNEDDGFRARWAEALALAELRLEEAMLVRAIDAATRGGVEGDLKLSPVTFRDALAFLNRPNKRRKPEQRRPVDPDAARASILKKVAAIKRAHQL